MIIIKKPIFFINKVTKALDILNQMTQDIRQIEVKDAEN